MANQKEERRGGDLCMRNSRRGSSIPNLRTCGTQSQSQLIERTLCHRDGRRARKEVQRGEVKWTCTLGAPTCQ